jgi:aryl-phospho-beta-D-glucosidase BglC (GH1 family)
VLPLDLDDSFRYSCDDDGGSNSTLWLGVNGKWIVDADGNHVVLRGIDLIDLGVQENDFGGSGHDSEIDAWTTAFWSYIAAKYKNNPRAIFELFNEPKTGAGGDIRWSTYNQ